MSVWRARNVTSLFLPRSKMNLPDSIVVADDMEAIDGYIDISTTPRTTQTRIR
jgi:hypothetical protein